MPSRSFIRSMQKDDDDFYPMYEGGKDKNDKYKEDLEKFKAPTGMNKDRGCTDCLCALIFIAFLASMIALTYLGFQDGDIKKLIAPVTYNDATEKRELCGYHNITVEEDGSTYEYDNTGYDYLVITDWSVSLNVLGIFDSGVCVKECPSQANSLAIECKDGVTCPTAEEAKL